MFTTMPTVARCCCCAPLRYGILVWAYIKLVTSIIAAAISLLWVFVWLNFIEYDLYLLVLIIFTTICFGIDVVFNFILILAAHKRNLSLLRTYYRYAFAHAVVFVLLGLLWMGYSVMIFNESLNYPEVTIFFIIMSLSIAIPLVLHVYLFIVLRSEMKKLESKEQMQFTNPLPDAFVKAGIQTAVHNQTNEVNNPLSNII